MKKVFQILRDLIILLIFIGVIVAISYLFTLFFIPQKTLRYQECILLQNPQDQKVDCFGCVKDICKDAPVDWVQYKKTEVGIPYNCIATETGCQMVQ